MEATTEAAVAACYDLSRKPGGVDEGWVSFAAAPAGHIPFRAFPLGYFKKFALMIQDVFEHPSAFVIFTSRSAGV
jgi:hypothetical protein